MDDILFIVLLFFIFIFGKNNYKNFEKFQNKQKTPENELYQTIPINDTTNAINQTLNIDITGLETTLGTLTGDIESKLNNTFGWIQSCSDYKEFCGTVYFPGTCRTRACRTWITCSCNTWGCSCTSKRTCWYWNRPCRKSKRECTPKLPWWKCSIKPSGYKAPKNPFPIHR